MCVCRWHLLSGRGSRGLFLTGVGLLCLQLQCTVGYRTFTNQINKPTKIMFDLYKHATSSFQSKAPVFIVSRYIFQMQGSSGLSQFFWFSCCIKGYLKIYIIFVDPDERELTVLDSSLLIILTIKSTFLLSVCNWQGSCCLAVKSH